MLRSEATTEGDRKKVAEGQCRWDGEGGEKAVHPRVCHRSMWLHLLRVSWDTQDKGHRSGRGARGQDRGNEPYPVFPSQTEGPPDDRIPTDRKTTQPKRILENRKCWDYKVAHFIRTNWFWNVLCESNCSIQIGWGEKKTTPQGGGISFFPLLVYHSILLFLSFFFGTVFFFFLSAIGACSRRKPNRACVSWWLGVAQAEWTSQVEHHPYPLW